MARAGKKPSPDYTQTAADPGTITGLPQTLPPGTLAILYDAGRSLAIVADYALTTYGLELGSEGSSASERERHQLPSAATGMAESSLGVVVATESDERSTLWLLANCELVRLIELDGHLTALVAAGAYAWAILSDGDGRRARIVQVNLRQRAVVAERELAHGEMKLTVDASGRQVVLTDRQARTVRTLDADLQWTPAAAPALSRQNPYAPPGRTSKRSCGCCSSCAPCGCGGAGDDPTRLERPSHPGEHDTPNDGGQSNDPGDGGRDHPGQVGVPADDGGTFVGNGDRVEHQPPPGRGRRPCGLNLFYTVADLQRIGAHVLATDRQQRSASLLSADMNLLSQWHLPRGGALLLTARGSSTLLMHHRNAGTWSWQDVYANIAKERIDLESFPKYALQSKTFIGQQTYALSHGQQPSPTSVKGILLPVIEGSQSYTSPDLAGFGAYLNRRMLPVIRDFYDENSFGTLKDVDVKVFGVNVGPAGGPLVLPRGKLADYFYPDYFGARLELVRSSVTAADRVTLDGREALTVNVKPATGGVAGGDLVIPFFALGFVRESDLFPFQVKFLGTERLTLQVKLHDGSAKTVTLAFTPKTIDITDTAAIPGKLSELATYLDGVMSAAESAAGIATRLFAMPSARRIAQIGRQFGRLVVTFKAASTAGSPLQIDSSAAVTPGGDPMGLATPLLGTMSVWDTSAVVRYLDSATLLAQEDAGFGYNNRMLNVPASNFDGAAGTLTTSLVIADRHGGIGAEVKLVSTVNAGALFQSTNAKANSATTNNAANTIRDFDDMLRDAFSAAIDRLRKAGQPTDALKDFGCVMVMPIEPPATAAGDPDAVLPSEVWNVTPLAHPFDFRGMEGHKTIIDRADDKIQLQSNWTLVFMNGGKSDNPLICHELGHALGLGDLYFQDGYRDELRYMEGWAMMSSHPNFPHHCGYHKLQQGWIDDGAGTETDYGRVFPLGLPQPDGTRTWDLLLVPVEVWRPSLVASARTAFAVGTDIPVVQLAWIDFGGDGATFGLIEARQPGVNFSRSLPIPTGGVLITNGIAWTLDERFATNGWYRRGLQLLNPDNVLRNAGDEFDLAMAPELPVKGMKVRVTDRKVVEGNVTVYRVTVTRENADFVDLYFDSPEVYYKNPDLWVDWAGNNTPTPDTITPDYPLGQPTDQGEAIRVHPSRTEQHFVVARVRNRGKVKATDIKVNFFYFDPPGAGDGKKPMDVKDLSHYKLIGSTTFPEVPGGDVPKKIPVRWDVPSGFGGHSCILVQIEDYRIPEDSRGAALGSDDVWQVNNHAQKNVDKYEALSASPFAPIGFDFSVCNAGMTPEVAYLEPDGLPYGMKLTVTPPAQRIGSDQTVLFHCKLELDDQIIRTGCENDQRFRLHAWRQDPESSARWGGVEYEIKPREKTATVIGGNWDWKDDVTVNGVVSPDPGGGTARIRIDFASQQARWVTVGVAPGGKFTWTERAPSGSFSLEAIAWFEGNRKFGSSRSNVATIEHPPVIR